MRRSTLHGLLTLALIAFPPGAALHAQPAPASAATVPDAAAPAPADSAPALASAASASDPVDLDDIRQFSRVYTIAKQAYVEKLDDKTLMKAAITGMLAGIDPHAEYLDKDGLQDLDEDTTGQYSGLGIEVLEDDGQLRVVSPIDDTPAARAGIKPGDTILKIDGTLVTDDNLDAMFKRLRGKPGSKITLTILHAKSGTPVDMHLTRETIAVSSVKVRPLEPGYVYIRLSQFQDDTAPDLEKKLGEYIQKNGMPKGAVLDLRSNPGGLVTSAVGAADDFLDGGTIVSMRGRLPDSNLSFSAHPGGDLLKDAPMVVLVDNGTASAAEILSGALKDNHRALLIGQRTFGKGVVQTVIPLDDDHAVKITTARYYTPDGTSIQAQGITPDIALGDLQARKVDNAPDLINSEADLPNHLPNQDAGATVASGAASAADAKLATQDYALSQALNVLKGLVLSHAAGAASAPATAH